MVFLCTDGLSDCVRRTPAWSSTSAPSGLDPRRALVLQKDSSHAGASVSVLAGANVLLDRSGGVNLCPLGALVGSTNLEPPFAFTDDCALAEGDREQQ